MSSWPTEIWQWIVSNAPVLALLKAVLWILPIFMVMPLCIWLERRLLAFMQDRLGPNRVGPMGLLQPVADGAKLFFKEDIMPAGVDRFIYILAPAVALFPAVTLGAVVPYAAPIGTYGLLTPVADVNIGVLYILAMSSLGVYGTVFAGYSGNNKFSLLGGLRASAQLISYELAMGMALACMVMVSGSLKISDIVLSQESPLWGIKGVDIENWNAFTPFGFLAMIIFLVCMIAETNRPPFDLPEAENELVAGYHTEYSSMKFATFYMGEYLAMLMFGTVFASVFLGGYNFLPINWHAWAMANSGAAPLCDFMEKFSYYLGPVWLLGKAIGVVVGYIWIRATLPRLRYDQLMNLGWRTLLPAAVGNLMVVALWITATATYGTGIGWLITLVVMAIWLGIYAVTVRINRSKGIQFEERSVMMVNPSVTTISANDKSPEAVVL